MNKIDEIICEIEGKIAYADSTGNFSAKGELCDIRSLLLSFKNSRESESLCISCLEKQKTGCCFKMPNVVLDRKVVRCTDYRKEQAKR